jgi:pimeloyl-ACP methyl ester carboxylesterase
VRYATTAALALLLLSGCVSFDVKEDHFFHRGPAGTASPIAVPGATVEPLQLRTADGTQLQGVSIERPQATVEVIYFGGNDFRLDDQGDAAARVLAPPMANLTCFDYRGYGRSTGTPTITALKDDALAIFDSVARRAPNRPIVVHGFSLGSFVAAYVAEHRPVAGLILESTAPSVPRWANNQIPLYARPFVRLHIAPALLAEDNEARLKTYTGPLLLLTGRLDPVTPPKFATDLRALSRSADKRVVIVDGATHGDVMTFEAAQRAYGTFLEAIARR